MITRAPPAYTLVEMLVVIGMFLVLLGVTLANFRSTIPRQALIAAAQQLASDVEAMRTAAMAGDPQHPDAVLFGIHASRAEPDRYYRFRAPAGFDVDSGERPEDIETAILPPRVTFVALSPETLEERAFSVMFIAPGGRIAIGEGASEAVFTLGYEGADGVVAVRVSGISGRIDVD